MLIAAETGTTNMRKLALAQALACPTGGTSSSTATCRAAPQTMKKLNLLLVGIALAISGTAPAHAAFTAVQPPPVEGNIALECSVVREQPQSRRPDPDPVYKTNINLTTNNGNFESFDVLHTVRSGAVYDRSQQYAGSSIWKTNNRMEWFWKGYRGTRGAMLGEVYWNARDGWMYQETIFDGNRPQTQILEDCHQVAPQDTSSTDAPNAPASFEAPPSTSAAHSHTEFPTDCSKAAKRVLASCLYGQTDHAFFNSYDRYAHPRSVEEYRRIVPRDDMYGFCRSAEHLKQCLQRFKEVLAHIPSEPGANTKASCIRDNQETFGTAVAKRMCDSKNYAKSDQLGWVCKLDSGKVTFHREKGGAKRKSDAVCE
jgi:hypothetical protein